MSYESGKNESSFGDIKLLYPRNKDYGKDGEQKGETWPTFRFQLSAALKKSSTQPLVILTKSDLHDFTIFNKDYI